jgi:6-phosphogluconolactonase (cycloisomerase 2 family)
MRSLGILFLAAAVTGAWAQATSPLLFVTNNVSGTVTTFTRGADGTLTFVGIYAAGTNPQDCGLTLDGRNLVVLNATAQTTEEIFTFVVNADGSMTRSEPPSTITDGPLSIAVSGTSFALVPSATGDSLTSFKVIGDNTQFVQSVAAGTFPSKILAAPNSKLAFLTDSGAREIRTFTLSETGILQNTDLDVLIGGSLQGLAISPDGNTLYSSTALTNHVYWLTVDYKTNTINQVSSATSGGNSCVELAVHPQGTYLYVCNVAGDTLTVMPIQPNGALSNSIYSYDIGNDVRDVVADGRYVYVTDETSIFSSPVGVIVFRIESNGSLKRLDTYLTSGTRPQHMQLWDPRHTTLAHSFQVNRGSVAGGTRQDLVASDDLRMRFRPGVTLSTSQAPIELTASARSPFAEPAEIRFHLESQTSSGGGIRQEILLYDWKADQYVEVDARTVGGTDVVVDVNRSDANRFIDDDDQSVRARIRYKQIGPVLAFPWEARIDRLCWTFLP